jgi:ABC-type antimicrobial peptide transport system permease subunit
MTQAPAPITTVALRTAGDPSLAAGDLRAALHALDPDMAVSAVRTLPDTIDAHLTQERLLAMLASSFGLLALVLTCVGIYGVISYAVERRTREIGIRLALGASRGQVAGVLMRQVGLLLAASMLLGGAGAVAAARAMRAMLFGFGANEYGMLAAVALVLALVAAAAGFLPARRAARLDPMAALRAM